MPTATEAQKCVSIIFNPTSGTGDPEQRRQTISQELADRGYTCQFLATTEQTGARELTKQALAEGVDLVVVSGGDGTIMETLAALVGTDVPVAVLPAGTGNLLAANLGIPTALPAAIELAVSGTTRKIDLAKTGEGRYFAIMGGIGLDAQLIHDADRSSKDRLGVLAYFVSAWNNRHRRRVWVRVQLDGAAPLRRKVKTVLIANMGRITGGLQAVPTADPHNGSLEVSIITVKTAWQWARLIGYALLGKTHADPAVEVYSARKVVLRCDYPELVQFDGEDGGRVKELSVESVPAAVNIVA